MTSSLPYRTPRAGPSGVRHARPVPDARRFWTLVEPVHALTYFAPEARAATEAIGLRGFWRGYFAGRLSPLGAVDAPVATALLFGFSPAMVARGVPGIWALARPEQALAARVAGVDPALRRLWAGAESVVAEVAEALRRVCADLPVAGRPLFAANTALSWPQAPHLAVWHGCTLLREHRGDGHAAALTAAGLDGCEALVTHAAAGGAPAEALHANRGWTDEQWQAAADRLTDRGWLADGRLTRAGAAVRQAVEDATDRAAQVAFAGLPTPAVDHLEALLAELARPVVASGIVPYPNPMGVPAPA
jgi:hypothetical protein